RILDQLTVSQVLPAILSIRNVRPQYCSISGMNCRESCSPRESSPARISSADLISTRSPSANPPTVFGRFPTTTAPPLSFEMSHSRPHGTKHIVSDAQVAATV